MAPLLVRGDKSASLHRTATALGRAAEAAEAIGHNGNGSWSAALPRLLGRGPLAPRSAPEFSARPSNARALMHGLPPQAGFAQVCFCGCCGGHCCPCCGRVALQDQGLCPSAEPSQYGMLRHLPAACHTDDRWAADDDRVFGRSRSSNHMSQGVWGQNLTDRFEVDDSDWHEDSCHDHDGWESWSSHCDSEEESNAAWALEELKDKACRAQRQGHATEAARRRALAAESSCAALIWGSEPANCSAIAGNRQPLHSNPLSSLNMSIGQQTIGASLAARVPVPRSWHTEEDDDESAGFEESGFKTCRSFKSFSRASSGSSVGPRASSSVGWPADEAFLAESMPSSIGQNRSLHSVCSRENSSSGSCFLERVWKPTGDTAGVASKDDAALVIRCNEESDCCRPSGC